MRFLSGYSARGYEEEYSYAQFSDRAVTEKRWWGTKTYLPGVKATARVRKDAESQAGGIILRIRPPLSMTQMETAKKDLRARVLPSGLGTLGFRRARDTLVLDGWAALSILDGLENDDRHDTCPSENLEVAREVLERLFVNESPK